MKTTFTAGGLCTLMFTIVYGPTIDEIPNNEIVTVKILGLIVGSDLHMYSTKEGFVTFVRGNYVSKDSNMIDVQDDNDIEDGQGQGMDSAPTYSKESKGDSVV